MSNYNGYCTRFFSALANRLRVRILQELTLRPMTVGEITAKLEAERTLVSHNLAMLSKAELVSSRRDGKTRIYTANQEVVPYVFLLMEKIVCSKCSIRKTCRAMRVKGLPMPQGMGRPPCKDCG
ncbi:MAG TPA: metalloregulator ArsR/SmtB family transcription factor [Candidatus Bilamarchaeum sp.]|nr:metalloregulator ArsR/SmtB family transcription factor [Candidatus Bilamarchaeum sp.]